MNEMLRSRPGISSSIRITPIEEGYLALDTKEDRVFQLNPLAALIFELCNGRRTVKEIIDTFYALFDDAVCSSDGILDWLLEADQGGLVSCDPAETAPPEELDGDELDFLAWRLNQRGEGAQAFICQKQAAELEPEDPDIWFSLAELAQAQGDRETALTAYRHYLELVPGDPEVAHLVVALESGTPPPRMPDKSVAKLYKRFSGFYDRNMRDELDYRAPELLKNAIESVLPDGSSDLSILDLGCGTGLAGPLLRPCAGFLVGLDISPEMADLARRRGCYDAVEIAEITDWLAKAEQLYYLVTACDVLIYFGDLCDVFAGVHRILEKDGLFAFTLEEGDRDSVTLCDSGRFAHGIGHVMQAAAEAGFEAAYLDRDVLRTEYDEPVEGIVVVLRKA